MLFSVRIFHDTLKPKYMFRSECHIILSDCFIASYSLSANDEPGHDGNGQWCKAVNAACNIILNVYKWNTTRLALILHTLNS